MYPELFTIPGTSYAVSTFGVMMAIGFLTAYGMTSHCMGERGLDVEAAPNILIWIMLGGVGGSKIYFAVDVWLREGLPFFDLPNMAEKKWGASSEAATLCSADRVSGASPARSAELHPGAPPPPWSKSVPL